MSEKEELLKKAQNGDKDAMFELGNLFAFEGDKESANKWWKKASKKGNATAKRSLKGSLLKKRPKDNGCAGCLIALVIIIVLFIAGWIIFGFEIAFNALLVLILIIMLLLKIL